MTTTTQEPTPQNVADLATQNADLGRPALIGVFGSQTAPAALIRDRKGTVQRVIIGDQVANQTVTAIAEDRVILARGGKTSTLTLPKS